MPASDRTPARPEFADPHVTLYAADLDPSRGFYRDVLGFTETFRVPRDGVPDYSELRLGSFRLGIATFDVVERHHGIRTDRGPPRFEVAFHANDVDGAYGWATSRGAARIKSPYDFLGYIHSACVADPDGNYVSFYTHLPVTTTADPTVRPTLEDPLFNLYTTDIERALQFYHGLLGGSETFRVPKPGPPSHVEMKLGSLNLAVSTLEALKRDHGLSGGGGPPRSEVVLSVKDVDAAYAWMCAHGVSSLSSPHNFGPGLRGAWVADPDGNPVQICHQSAVG